MDKKFLTESEVAEMIGLSRQTLANWRSLGRGPAYCKIGGHAVRYSKEEILRFAENGRVETCDQHTA